MRRLTFALAVLLLALAMAAGEALVATPAGPRDPSWDRLQSLVGEWDGHYGDGTSAHVSYRLVSSGTAVMETLTTSDSDQMVTIYHRDGASLLLTHYCSLGNQTRMRERVAPGTSAGRLEFAYVDATNLKSPNEHHMSGLVMRFPAPDRLVHEWTSRAGASEQTGRFEFERQK